ncbi:MAG: hypothetical protein GZ094_07980 [Mariniphaga sp.]|nr:hypothetical protein [Mariniphaga sp.]
MRKLIVVIMLIMSSVCAMAQATTDLGVQVAAATYWGDIENVNYSKSITPVVGILGRYNFNRRLAIRGQLFTGNLKAEGLFTNANIWQSGAPRVNDPITNIEVPYPRNNPDFNYYFNRSFQSVEALFEFNFRDYKLGRTKKDNWTPFVSVGLGGFFSRASRVGSFILEPSETVAGSGVYAPIYLDGVNQLSNNSDVLTLTIPVGVGLKFNITKRLGGIIEVIARKTFADNIDNLDDPQRFILDPNGTPPITYPDKVSGMQLNNNDWYATLAVSVCYQLWSSKGNCAIYDKIKK